MNINKEYYAYNIIYIILTSIFGDYDILKDPEEIDPYAYYICITDNKDLKSNVWHIIYDEELANSSYTNLQKAFIIKYKKIFSYFNLDSFRYIVRLDASIQLHKPLYPIIKYLYDNDYDCCLMLHPERNDMIDEYNEWETLRNHNKIYKDTFIREMSKRLFDINNTGLIETTLQIYKINSTMYHFVNDLSNTIESITNFTDNNDQCYYTYVLSKYINYIKPLFVNRQIISSDYMDLCFHYTNEIVYKDHIHARGPKGEHIYDLDTPIHYKLFNKYYTIKYF